jgi:hypothetical protein
LIIKNPHTRAQALQRIHRDRGRLIGKLRIEGLAECFKESLRLIEIVDGQIDENFGARDFSIAG